MSNNYGPRIVTDGLVLCLDAADQNSYSGSGNTWTDLSGNGNNGTLTNGPTFNSDNGGCLSFDASNDYVEVGSSSDLDVSSGNFTVSIFFYMNSSASTSNLYYSLFNMDPSSNQGDTFYIRIWRSGLYPGALFTRINNVVVLSTDGASSGYPTNYYYNSIGRWTDITFVENNGTSYYYLNGIEYRSISTPTIPSGNNKATIGWANSTALNGNVASTKFYNRALTASEIQQNYQATKGRFGL